MKKIALLLCLALLIASLAGCTKSKPAQIAATTLPVYEFTVRLCDGTGITVTRLITEEVSCLHDYTLKTTQMRSIEAAELIVINGGGLEDFLEDVLVDQSKIVDSSASIQLHHSNHHGHDEHDHQHDPHFWLSPTYAKMMVENICNGLCAKFPQHEDTFLFNKEILFSELNALERYGKEQLASLDCKKLITFHDGFSYFAESFHLEIIRAIEEESGSEASAKELIELIQLVDQEQLPAIFIERSSSSSAAEIISKEIGVKVYALDMAMSGDSYFSAMNHNINILKEALS